MRFYLPCACGPLDFSKTTHILHSLKQFLQIITTSFMMQCGIVSQSSCPFKKRFHSVSLFFSWKKLLQSAINHVTTLPKRSRFTILMNSFQKQIQHLRIEYMFIVFSLEQDEQNKS